MLDGHVGRRARSTGEGRDHLHLGGADHVAGELLVHDAAVQRESVLLQEWRLGLGVDIHESAGGGHDNLHSRA